MDAQRMDALRSALMAGRSLRAAAAECGLSPSWACRLLADDPTRRKRWHPLTPTERQRILRLARNGETSVRRISAAVERSWHAVRHCLDISHEVRIISPHRCPRCGYRITTSVCLICRASPDD